MFAALPHDFPAPELVGVVDDGDWVVLITEWIDGYTPSEPLSEADVNRFLLLAERLAAAGERRHPTGVRPVHAALHFLWDNW